MWNAWKATAPHELPPGRHGRPVAQATHEHQAEQPEEDSVVDHVDRLDVEDAAEQARPAANPEDRSLEHLDDVL